MAYNALLLARVSGTLQVWHFGSKEKTQSIGREGGEVVENQGYGHHDCILFILSSGSCQNHIRKIPAFRLCVKYISCGCF